MKKFLKGFSLIELLVAISIMSVLLAMGTVSYTSAQRKGRDGRRRADMKEIQKALEQYYQNYNSTYPASLASGDTLTVAPAAGGASAEEYIIPTDPKNDPPYEYSYSYSVGGGATPSYCFCTRLEEANKGNASGGSGGVCDFASGSGANFFCVRNLQ
jgi:prepilin-type N-terminal cleavage/methylation domain-containing protein